MKKLIVAAFALSSLGLSAEAATAKTVQICNYSTSDNVAVAYSRYLDNRWWVQGWRRIDQGECSDFYHEGSSFYYYAKSANGEWSGSIPRCVLSQRFKLVSGSSCHNGQIEYFTEKWGLGEFSRLNLVD